MRQLSDQQLAKERPRNPWDQVSKDYEGQIISPLLHAQKNPLWARLKKLAPESSALDLGCGTGNLLPYLIQHFKQITALDGSAGMLKQAQAKANSFLQQQTQFQDRKLDYVHTCMEKLGELNRQWDVIIAVNSLITPDFKHLENTFQGLRHCLNEQGRAFIIVPSMESIWEEFRFTYQQELAKYKGKGLAKARTRKKLDTGRIDWELGEYHTDDMAQKYYTQWELHNLVKQAGFKIRHHDEVIYQHGPSFNYHDQRADNEGPRMWDHYLEVSR